MISGFNATERFKWQGGVRVVVTVCTYAYVPACVHAN